MEILDYNKLSKTILVIAKEAGKEICRGFSAVKHVGLEGKGE